MHCFWWNTILVGLTMLIAATGCSSENEVRDVNVVEFLDTHPYPFELHVTDSSIIGRYVRQDTLARYVLGVTYPANGDIREMAVPPDTGVFVPLRKDSVYEWAFTALGVDSFEDEYHVLFADLEDTSADYMHCWQYDRESRTFEKTVLGVGQSVDIPWTVRWLF